MRPRDIWILVGSSAAALILASSPARAEIPARIGVRGVDITDAEIAASPRGDARVVPWASLATTILPFGMWRVRFLVTSGGPVDALEIPVCGNRKRIFVDGAQVTPPDDGPFVVRFEGDAPAKHEIVLDVQASTYEKRIVCGDAPKAGTATPTREGVSLLRFESPHAKAGGGRAAVYVPPGHDLAKPGPLLVGVHPWNGDHWTYAHYAELLAEARAKDVLLLMPNGLGNSLYVADAEDEVMLAVDTMAKHAAVDPRAVSIWGASMGGAGATTIGFHHPDRFATITSWFGDSKYDLTTYVKHLIPDERAANAVNALDVVDNVRHVPVWLIHGDADKVSDIQQSVMLDAALRARGFKVRFDAIRGAGHEGPLVSRFLPEVVRTAASARVPETVSRVSYRSFRAVDSGAYGVHYIRAIGAHESFVDVERRDGALHVLAARGVRSVSVSRPWFGLKQGETVPIVIDDVRAKGLAVDWRD